MESGLILKNIIKNGLRADSVKNMVFGAGVLYRNFAYGTHYSETFDKFPQNGKEYYYMTVDGDYTLLETGVFTDGTTYFEKYEGYGGDKIGATKDGTKVTVTPEYTDIEVDGVLVKMEGLTRKTGEKAAIEAVVVDMSPQNIITALNGEIDPFSSYADGSDVSVVTKSDITEGDYITNLALASRRLDDGKLMVIIFKKALCTSGLELDMKNKEISGSKYVFEAVADTSDTNAGTLPIIILTEETV